MGDIVTGFEHGQYGIVADPAYPYAINSRCWEEVGVGRDVRRVCNVLFKLGEGDNISDHNRTKQVRQCDTAGPRCNKTDVEG